MTIKERFLLIIKERCDGNKSAFAQMVGVSPTVIENVVGAREGKPSYEVLVKICANANINAEWLLLEKGDMTNDESEDNANDAILSRKEKISLSTYKVLVSNLERKIKVMQHQIDELEQANEDLTHQLLAKDQSIV